MNEVAVVEFQQGNLSIDGIDSQIATAKRYPRDLKAVRQQAMDMALWDDDTAAGCMYALPRKDKDGKPTSIQGPSVRLAEIMVYAMGNIRVQTRIVAENERDVIVQGLCIDLEKNVGVAVEVKRRITTSNGRRYSDDMIVMTTNAATSIAYRNAAFKAVPASLMRPIYEAARQKAVGDQTTLVVRRTKALDTFMKMGITRDRILSALGVEAEDAITLEHLQTMIGMHAAIKNNESTLDELFPIPGESSKSPQKADVDPTALPDVTVVDDGLPETDLSEAEPWQVLRDGLAAIDPMLPAYVTTMEGKELDQIPTGRMDVHMRNLTEMQGGVKVEDAYPAFRPKKTKAA